MCTNAYASQKTFGNHLIQTGLTVGGDATVEGDLVATGRFQAVDTGVTIINTSLHVGSTGFDSFLMDVGDVGVQGEFYAAKGVNTVAIRYGAGAQVREYALEKSLIYDIDATFTVATATIEKIGEKFVTDGVVAEDFLVVTDANDKAYIGSTGEIISVEETKIVVSMAAAGADVPTNLTDFDFIVYNHPLMAVLDNGDIHFKVGVSPDASFKIHTEDSNNEHAVHFVTTAGVDGNAALEIEYDPDTYSDTSAIEIGYDATGFDSDLTVGTILDVIIDNANGATAGDIHVVDVAVSSSTNLAVEIEALVAHPGVDVIAQYLGTPASLATAWEHDGSFNDRTAEFDSTVTDVQIFDSDNDYILLASATVFDEINIILDTEASHTIIPVFEYIENDGAWIVFTPADDTNGFQQSGTIRYESDDLATWGVRTILEVTGSGAEDDYYWVRITRTRNILPTSPIEDTIQVTALGSKFKWDRNGDIYSSTIRVNPVSEVTCDANAGGKIFFDSDDSTFYGCDGSDWKAFH